ncbi:unnamed protein product [marine sediment metagenome]|uniref:Uncharacterized protein n=1 Tax=marine sediment metagenome TaxID=412755 RepID=X0UGV2_9ZZZZ
MEASKDFVRLGEIKEKILNEIDKSIEHHAAPNTVMWLKALKEVNFQIRRLK